jgi:hypothetical protein
LKILKDTEKKKQLEAEQEVLAALNKDFQDPGPMWDVIAFHDGKVCTALISRAKVNFDKEISQHIHTRYDSHLLFLQGVARCGRHQRERRPEWGAAAHQLSPRYCLLITFCTIYGTVTRQVIILFVPFPCSLPSLHLIRAAICDLLRAIHDELRHQHLRGWEESVDCLLPGI